MIEWYGMQKEPNTQLRDLLITCKLGKTFTKVVRSNEKNMNRSLMERLIVCHCHELETNPEGEQNQRTLIFGVE